MPRRYYSYRRGSSAYSTLKGMKMYDAYKRGLRRRRYAAYVAKKWPRENYARIFVPRGTQASLDAYGETKEAATAEQLKNREKYGFTGRGRYGVRKFVRDINHLVPKKVGRALTDAAVKGIEMAPAMAMMAAGSGLYGGRGEYDGEGLYGGRGEYNSLIAGGRMAPQFAGANDETGGLTISHHEYLQDVYGAPSTGFTCDSWSLNPGLLDNFPFLSQIACNFEEYEWVQLVFEYRSTVDASAINNTNGATGTVIMATNYNPSAPIFNNKEQMMQYHGAVSGRVVEDHSHGVECDASKNAGSPQKLIRTNPVLLNNDIKAFDLGNFCLGQVNLPTAFQNQQIGELWVYYTVRLDKPRMYTSLGNACLEQRVVSNGGESVARILGAPQNVLTMQQGYSRMRIIDNFDGSVALLGTGWLAGPGIAVTFPDFCTGLFEVQIDIELPSLWVTGARTLQCLPTGNPNIGFVTDYYASAVGGTGTDSPQNMVENASSTGFSVKFKVWVTPSTGGVDNSVQYSWANVSVAPTQCAVIVRQINSSFGPTPNSAPIYINSSGVATIP